ncbi:hypothetical protein ACFY94_34690 [Streptomyces griseorubiginosus]|uniref:hypothetical protein n=1 Tax=Streptomyces TaxID=1883 RepID=UPI0004BEFFF1|nr:hypothetical protein [Streptomyces sp. NRRL B-3229]
MPEHVSVYQLLGVTLLVLVVFAWTAGLAYLLRHGRHEAVTWRVDHGLPAFPRQRLAAPGHESVALTAAEEDAFAGLVRQLSGGR